MNRFDAYAMPLRDLFQGTLNVDSAYTVMPARVPISETNSTCSSTVDSFISSQIDFTEPDRDPILGEVLWHRATGKYLPGSRIEHLLKAQRFDLPDERGPDLDEGHRPGPAPGPDSEDVLEHR